MLFGALSFRRAADQLFDQAERAVALLARVQPLNARRERERLQAAWQGERRLAPRFSYSAVPDMQGVRDALEKLMLRADSADPISQLYAERAAELTLESRIVEAVGRPEFRRLASRRFISNCGALQEADALSLRWAGQGPASPSSSESVCTDDDTQPNSLISLLRAELYARHLPVRVSPSQDLSALAATGEKVIFVATGRFLSEESARRVVVHEVLGHCVPRVNARRERLGLFVVGSAQGNDDQEGYALSIEERTGHLGHGRRFELALRHIIAKAMFEGADFQEAVELAQRFDAPSSEAISIATRVFRGGGLGREIAYLPALCRILEQKETDQGLVSQLSRGRMSLGALRLLRDSAAMV